VGTSPVRALLFDFDGLIVDTETPAFRSWQEIYSELGHTLPLSRWAAAVGTLDGFDPYADLQRLTGRALDGDVRERRRSRKRQLTLSEPALPGVREYLAAAKRLGLRIGIVSSNSRAWIDEHLARLGLTDPWDTIRSADGDAALAKPRPTLYLVALHDLAVRADEAIAFEDSPNGIRAAKLSHIFCVAVPNPVTEHMDLSGADLVIASLADLPVEDLLKRVGGDVQEESGARLIR
jgi:HAD superfamily hydrolase (TIGR01509 family)